MPDLDNERGIHQPKALTRRAARNVNRLARTKIEWRGRGLRLLAEAEARLIPDLDIKTEDPIADAASRCRTVNSLCQILDTRRVLVGDPLPGTLRPSAQRTLDAWSRTSVPAQIISPPVATAHAEPSPATGQQLNSAQVPAVVPVVPI